MFDSQNKIFIEFRVEIDGLNLKIILFWRILWKFQSLDWLSSLVAFAESGFETLAKLYFYRTRVLSYVVLKKSTTSWLYKVILGLNNVGLE